jgi:hypothetical protein
LTALALLVIDSLLHFALITLTTYEISLLFYRKIFTYGPMYLGGNGAFAGLIANSLYRRALNVTQGRFTSNLPMAVLPFLTTVAMYNVAVSKPLLSGECLIVSVAVEV